MEQERCTIRPAAGLFLEPCTTTLTILPQVPSTLSHLPPLCGGLHGQNTGNNNRVIPLHNIAQTQWNKTIQLILGASKNKAAARLRWRRRGVCWGKWTSTPNELLRTGAQRCALFLGPIKSSGIKILHHLTSQDLSVMLREVVTLKVMHSERWKGRCLMIFKKEQVMTEISLAGGRWHSVRLAFVRFVKGLHQQTCEALSNGLIITKITSYCTNCGQK